MSFGWTQNDEAMLQVPPVQRPEQQLTLAAQVFPAVVHAGFGAIDAHLPAVQLPVQQALPAAGHASPMLMHCAGLHVPLTQAPLQQSVLSAHAAFAGAQAPSGEAASPGLPMTPPSPPSATPPSPPSPLSMPAS